MGNSEILSKKELFFLNLIRSSILSEEIPEDLFTENLFDMELLALSEKHFVSPLICDTAEKIFSGRQGLLVRIRSTTDRIVMQGYHLLLETVRVVRMYEDAGITIVVLKGVAAASFYPMPEYRKSGDIDILITDAKKLQAAVDVACANGYIVSESQHALHHVVMEAENGIMLEIHTAIAEPFDNAKINRYMDSVIPDIENHIVKKQILGFEIPILDDDYQPYELLLHMLQHFLREGFGLKLLCDWALYWNDYVKRNGNKEPARYLEHVKLSRIPGFAGVVSQVCFQYFGLNEQAYQWLTGQGQSREKDELTAAEFMAEVLRSGEFGCGESGRMVVLRDGSIFAYIREFHHQMHLNFPAAGKVFLFWPALWIFTLARFLRNNRRLRKISSREIFSSAKKRSSIMKKINLWK